MIALASIAFALKRAGYFILDHWKLVAAGVVFLIVVIFFGSKCGPKPPAIDHDKINKINTANETERKQELQDIIEQNQDVVRTVDNRAAITELHVTEVNREIDAKVKEADRAIVEAKKQGRDITAQELECLLLPDTCNK